MEEQTGRIYKGDREKSERGMAEETRGMESEEARRKTENAKVMDIKKRARRK